jgi:glucan endo-1,3-alpha-glucosidase
MSQILELQPEFVEVITWVRFIDLFPRKFLTFSFQNDGGESHYIGNLWEDGYIITPKILQYANTSTYPHYAWQPLITSFINAYKSGLDASQMRPPSGDPIGAMWYHPNLMNCTGHENISGSGSAQDAVNYAVVMPADTTGMEIIVTSGGTQIDQRLLQPGLNYASVAPMLPGLQRVEIISGGNTTIMAATSFVDVPETSDMCNFNYFVEGLV